MLNKILKNKSSLEQDFLNTKKIKLNESNEETFNFTTYRSKEKDLYIIELINNNNNNKFDFEFKKYYSDFVVHEISSNGDIIELNNFDIKNSNLTFDTKELEIDYQDCLKYIDINKIKLFDESKLDITCIDIDVTNFNKNLRKNIHYFVNNSFKNLCTFTLDLNENNTTKKVIRIQKHTSKQDKRNYKKQRNKVEDYYLHFNMYQENRGTIQAVLDITKNLKISPKNIHYAGTKDKRSISTQHCCLYKTKVERLLDYNKKASNYKFPIVLGNFSYQKNKCFLGQLAGNRFDLVLRNAKINSLENFEKSIQCLKENGFINYFGLQRFGLSVSYTYKVGLLLLKKSYENAINLILSYRLNDLKSSNEKFPKSFNECLKIYKEKNDAKTAYKEFYWKNFNEGWLLKGLSLYDNNFSNALNVIPRNSRLLYCHAYQSFIWNKIATFRYKNFGLNVVLGDLVTLQTNIKNGKLINNSNHQDETLEDEVEDDTGDVIIVDESNINKFTIYDVVLPLIGSKIKLPENLIKNELIKILEQDGISLENFNNSNVKYFLTGKYRRFLIKPIDFNYKILENSNNLSNKLLKTDLDKLNNTKVNIEEKNFIKKNNCSDHLIKLNFSLPSSSYATIMLREISGAI